MTGKRACTLCHLNFTVTHDDQKFYDSAHIPPPTLCPNCRVQRRMTWRNDRTFWVRKCDLTGEQFVSGYPTNAPFPVYKPDVWWSDKWNPLDYGQDIDFTRPFFEQWHELFNTVPRLGIDIVNCENSDYCNYCGDDKNCYLDIAGERNEDCYYCLFTKYSKNCVDCTFVYESELCYETINAYNCHNVQHSMYMDNCVECMYCFDLKGCRNCLFSSNLRNKEYYIFNQPYSKAEYERKLHELAFGSYKQRQEYLAQWKEVMQKAIHRDAYMTNSENCTGNNIKNSHNCQHAFNVSKSENSKFLYDVLDAKECYDLNYSLYDPEQSVELISTLNMRYSAFSMASHYCYNAYYVDQCNNSHDLFGCIGLNKKQFCILNKQYSESEYKQLRDKLIDHMSATSGSTSGGKETGEWGEFFPGRLSPFAYNETVAQEYFPLTQADCETKRFKWKEPDPKDQQAQTKEIPDDIANVPDSIIGQLLADEKTGKNYKIVKQELELYHQLNIPVPRRAPNQRHQDRMALRNPRQLWHRQCMCEQVEHDHGNNDTTQTTTRCPNEFETTYHPDRVEIIYCRECYQAQLY